MIKDNERIKGEEQIAKRFFESEFFHQSMNIGCYFAIKDELNTKEIVSHIWHTGKYCYLPVIDENGQYLQFARYKKTTLLQKNRYGIMEPVERESYPIHQLDVVLVPLLAFDEQGFRLGMGGGFYDKTFEFLITIPRAAKPLLIGLAFEQQKIISLPHDAFDVSLNAVITEQGIHSFPLHS